jgi:cobalt-zinc-cadmium efflux system membrane fusion protein
MNHSTYYCLALIALLSSCSKTPSIDEATAIQKDFVPSVDFRANLAFDTVKIGSYAAPLTVVGDVTFDEDNVVRIFPIVSGSVERVYFSLGDYVRKGQLMATILSTDISTYQRDFSIAKSNLEVATKNRDRVKALHTSNFASDKDLQIAENEFANAQAEFVGKKQILKLFGGNSQSSDAVYNVYAPRSGYLVERKVNEGTQIRTDNADALFTLSDLRTIWVQANVYESDYARVKLGDEVEATTIAFPNDVFRGKVEKINSILDSESRVIRVRTELSNPGEKLLPGMFATIHIIPARKTQAIAVPESAVFLEKNEPFVVVTKGSALIKVKIKTGLHYGTMMEVQSGLAEGSVVVTTGALLVANEINNR